MAWTRAGGAGAVAIALLAAAPAAGSPRWLEPQEIAGPGQSGLFSQVAASRTGDAIAVWHSPSAGDQRRIRSAFRPAGGVFGPAETISADPEPGTFPDVA